MFLTAALIAMASGSYWYVFVDRYVIGISEGSYALGRHLIQMGDSRDDIRRSLGSPTDTLVTRDSEERHIEEWDYHHWDGSHFVLVFYSSGDTVIRILHFKNLSNPSRWAYADIRRDRADLASRWRSPDDGLRLCSSRVAAPISDSLFVIPGVSGGS